MLMIEHSFKCVKPETAKGLRDTFVQYYNCQSIKVKQIKGGFMIEAVTVGPYLPKF